MEATGWKRAKEPAQLLGQYSWEGRTETKTLWPPAQVLASPQEGRSLLALAMAEPPPYSKGTIKTHQDHVMSMHLATPYFPYQCPYASLGQAPSLLLAPLLLCDSKRKQRWKLGCECLTVPQLLGRPTGTAAVRAGGQSLRRLTREVWLMQWGPGA